MRSIWKNKCRSITFYRAMLCIRGICYGRVSVRLPVTSRCFAKTAKRWITQTKPHDSQGTPGSGLVVQVVSALLCGSGQDFNCHDASRGPSAIAELLISEHGVVCSVVTGVCGGLVQTVATSSTAT